MKFHRAARLRFACLALASTSLISNAQDCFQSTVLSPSPFMGNDGEIFKISDGSIWQIKYEYEYLYEYYPNVLICPQEGKLVINGKELNIAPISSSAPNSNTPSAEEEVIESQIDGDFNGFEGESIFKLTNGQVWQQTEYLYHYHYSFMPKVTIYKQGGGFKIKVNGVDNSVGVVRLK